MQLAIKLLFLFALFYSGASPAAAAEELKIMFVGNSLTGTHNMPREFIHLAKVNGKNPYVEKYITYDKGLSYHLTRVDLRQALSTKKWDYIILQDYSNIPLINPQSFEDNLKAFKDLIRPSGAKIVLFENWPYLNSPLNTIAQLDAVYAHAALVIGADVVPLGHAVDFVSRHSQIKMYVDEKHPTPLATYMCASMWLRYFYDIQAIGNVPGGRNALPDFFQLKDIRDSDFHFVQDVADRFKKFQYRAAE